MSVSRMNGAHSYHPLLEYHVHLSSYAGDWTNSKALCRYDSNKEENGDKSETLIQSFCRSRELEWSESERASENPFKNRLKSWVMALDESPTLSPPSFDSGSACLDPDNLNLFQLQIMAEKPGETGADGWLHASLKGLYSSHLIGNTIKQKGQTLLPFQYIISLSGTMHRCLAKCKVVETKGN